MEETRGSVVFYNSFYEAICHLPEDVQLQVYDAVFAYSFYGREPDLDGTALSIWVLIKPQIDANIRRRENGTKGGRKTTIAEADNKQNESKNKPKEKQNKTKSKPNTNQDATESKPNVNVNVNANVNANANGNGSNNAAAEHEAVTHYLTYVNPAPSRTVIDTIDSYIKDGMTNECLIAIFDYCRDNNKLGWSYIKSAVQGCFKDGIRTLEDYRRKQIEREATVKKGNSKTKSKFHNFEQRNIDYSDIEDEYFAEILNKEKVRKDE